MNGRSGVCCVGPNRSSDGRGVVSNTRVIVVVWVPKGGVGGVMSVVLSPAGKVVVAALLSHKKSNA